MQNAFLSNFKNVKINGKFYAVSQTKQTLIYLVYIVQLFMMVLIFLPDFGKSLNLFPNEFFEYLEEKKWFLMLLVFFMGNFITGIIGNSGAFEVYVNNKLVFSKLNIGRVPDLDEIVSLIRKMDLQLIGIN